MAATTIATSWSTTILGPLTTTWTPPPACSVVVAECSTCTKGWAAQTCLRDSLKTDDPGCWPPRTSGVYTPPAGNPLLAWGIYSPGIVCPQGYSAACSYDGAAQTGDFEFDFSPRETEAATGCCPTGHTCGRPAGDGQKCSLVLTSSTNAMATVTCESGTSAAYGYITVPFAAIDTSRIVSISIFTAYAPLFQLVHQISTTSSTSTSASSNTTSTPSQTTSPPTNSSQNQGLSAGAAAGIGCGAGLGVILLGAAAFCAYRHRKRKAGGGGEVKPTREQPTREQLTRELPAYAPVVEIRSDRDPVELEARRGVILQSSYGQAPHPGL